MTDRNDITGDDAAIEEILRHASPRTTPSEAVTANVRASVETEWRVVTGRRRRARRSVTFAAAASVLLAVGAAVFLLRLPSAIPVQVATIEKTIGTIYLLGEHSELNETPGLSELLVGQTLGTGEDSGVALAWLGGGSLRIDQDSRVEIRSRTEIFLHAGRVYFDSGQAADDTVHDSRRGLAIHTREGEIRHAGTQYMTGLDNDGLTVSVREGAVAVAGSYHDAAVSAGESVLLSGTNDPVLLPVTTHGTRWLWVERLAPAPGSGDRSPHELASWVARETGLRIRYDSEETRRFAHDAKIFVDTAGMEPRPALVILEVAGMQATIEDGAIEISGR